MAVLATFTGCTHKSSVPSRCVASPGLCSEVFSTQGFREFLKSGGYRPLGKVVSGDPRLDFRLKDLKPNTEYEVQLIQAGAAWVPDSVFQSKIILRSDERGQADLSQIGKNEVLKNLFRDSFKNDSTLRFTH